MMGLYKDVEEEMRLERNPYFFLWKEHFWSLLYTTRSVTYSLDLVV